MRSPKAQGPEAAVRERFKLAHLQPLLSAVLETKVTLGWKKQWFKLYDRVLARSDPKKTWDPDLKGLIYISDIANVQGPLKGSPNKATSRLFSLSVAGQTLQLRASSMAEANQWCEAIEKSIRERSQIPPSPVLTHARTLEPAQFATMPAANLPEVQDLPQFGTAQSDDMLRIELDSGNGDVAPGYDAGITLGIEDTSVDADGESVYSNLVEDGTASPPVAEGSVKNESGLVDTFEREFDDAEVSRKLKEAEAAQEAEARRRLQEAEANFKAVVENRVRMREEEIEAQRAIHEALASRKAEAARLKICAEEAEAAQRARAVDAKRKADEAEARYKAAVEARFMMTPIDAEVQCKGSGGSLQARPLDVGAKYQFPPLDSVPPRIKDVESQPSLPSDGLQTAPTSTKSVGGRQDCRIPGMLQPAMGGQNLPTSTRSPRREPEQLGQATPSSGASSSACSRTRDAERPGQSMRGGAEGMIRPFISSLLVEKANAVTLERTAPDSQRLLPPHAREASPPRTSRSSSPTLPDLRKAPMPHTREASPPISPKTPPELRRAHLFELPLAREVEREPELPINRARSPVMRVPQVSEALGPERKIIHDVNEMVRQREARVAAVAAEAARAEKAAAALSDRATEVLEHIRKDDPKPEEHLKQGLISAEVAKGMPGPSSGEPSAAVKGESRPVRASNTAPLPSPQPLLR